MNRCWLALLLLALGGCGHQAIDFNNQVAAIHTRLGTAVEEYGRVLRPAIDEGRAPSPDDFAAAAERLRSELAAAEERSAQLQVPKLPQAEELYAAHQAFLAWQRSRLEEELPKIERLLDQSLGGKVFNAQSAHSGLADRFAAMREQERGQLETMHAAQRRFAEANGLKLIHVAETASSSSSATKTPATKTPANQTPAK